MVFKYFIGIRTQHKEFKMVTLNINPQTQSANFGKLTTNVNQAKEAEEASKVEKAQKAQAAEKPNATNTLERTPEEDSCSFSNNCKEMTKEAIKSASLLYVAGFCLGFCPGLFMIAAGAFLFSNKGQSFMEKLADTITSNAGAMNKFNEVQAKDKEKQAEKAEQAPAAENNAATNPIQNAQPVEAAKEAEQMTPMEKAQADVEKREKAVAMRAARLEQAQADYDAKQAKLEQAYQRVESYKKAHNAESETLNKSYGLRQDEAARANKNLVRANAEYKKANADLEAARLILADMQAEEIVDVDAE